VWESEFFLTLHILARFSLARFRSFQNFFLLLWRFFFNATKIPVAILHTKSDGDYYNEGIFPPFSENEVNFPFKKKVEITFSLTSSSPLQLFLSSRLRQSPKELITKDTKRLYASRIRRKEKTFPSIFPRNDFLRFMLQILAS
jgi:hypothetical protein